MKPLIIVGIDPGATLAYTILDLNSKLIRIKSAKQHTFSNIISEIINYGIPLITCCDKNPPPRFAEKFATKTGSKLIYPKKDLLTIEKENLTKNYKAKNIHQKDSLASALFGFNEIRPVLKKISKNLKAEKKEIKYKVTELVIKQGIPISEALRIIKSPEEIKEEIEEKFEERQIAKIDYLILCNKLEQAKKDITLLKMQNNNLKQQLFKAARDYSKMLNKIRESANPELQSFKQQKITNSLKNKIQDQEKIISKLKRELDITNSLLSDTANNLILKKIDNLGYNEYQNKNRILNIKQKEILLVNNLNIISEKTINELKNKISVIIYNQATKNILDKLPFTCISSKNLKIQENKYFAIINKSELEREMQKQTILSKVLEQYQEERSL